MTTKLLIFFTLLFPSISFGQTVNDSLLSTFYNKTLISYFSDTAYTKNQSEFNNILIQTEFDTIQLIKYYNKNKLTYFNSKTNIRSIIEKPYKKNNGRNIYWISHKLLQKDTVDINISGWTIIKITKKTMGLGAWCGGTMGYIPEGRFIFNSETKTWTFFCRKEIINNLLRKD